MSNRDLWEDAAGAVGRIRRHPRTPAVLAIALAVALGAVTGVLDIARRVLFAPLPYPLAARTVVAGSQLGGFLISYYTWQPNPRAQSVFEGIADVEVHPTILALGSRNRLIQIGRATPGFFSALGVKMALGAGLPRTLPPRTHSIPWLPIVLSNRLWRDDFAANRGIVGREIRLSFLYPYSFQVVGVAPPGVRFPGRADAWAPIGLQYDPSLTPSVPDYVVGRLRPGISIAAAEAAIRTWPRNQFLWDWDNSARLVPIRAFLGGAFYRLAPVLWLLTALFLALAIAAAVGLWRQEFRAREKEFWIRKLLGCRPGRLLRSLSIEVAAVFLLALAGACFVRLIVIRVTAGLGHLAAPGSARLGPADAGLALAALAVAAACILIPEGIALDAIRLPGRAGGWPGRMRSAARLRFPLLMTTAAVILVLAAVLLEFSVSMSRINTGLRAQGVFVGHVTLPIDRGKVVDRGFSQIPPDVRGRVLAVRQAHFSQAMDLDFSTILDRIRGQAGVVGAGLTTMVPCSGLGEWSTGVYPSRGPAPKLPRNSDAYVFVNEAAISAGVIPALGMRVLDGHNFPGGSANRNTVLINQAMSRVMGGPAASIGRFLSAPNWPSARIIGIVNDVRPVNVFSAPVPTIYYPFSQYGQTQADVVVRTAGGMPFSRALSLTQSAARSVVPGAIVSRFQALPAMIRSAATLTRYTASLLLVLAALSLFLVGICVWADAAGQARRREHEIGIRLAVGARQDQVVRLMVRRQAVETFFAVAAGTIVAWWLASILGYLFHGIEPGVGVFTLSAAAVVAYTVIVSTWALARRIRSCPRDLIASESQ